ncbi:AAA family ATPase [Streptomyces sp. NPDC095613]|uniref:AAA family ATPase n=1 Tax=Streptomyces sp. NPDC095613 TaxID=3155540 RepID=UPI00331818E1
MGTLLSITNRCIDRTGPVTAPEVLRGHGPPGTGKTTLARLLADVASRHFVALSALSSGVKRAVAAIAARYGPPVLSEDPDNVRRSRGAAEPRDRGTAAYGSAASPWRKSTGRTRGMGDHVTCDRTTGTSPKTSTTSSTGPETSCARAPACTSCR